MDSSLVWHKQQMGLHPARIAARRMWVFNLQCRSFQMKSCTLGGPTNFQTLFHRSWGPICLERSDLYNGLTKHITASSSPQHLMPSPPKGIDLIFSTISGSHKEVRTSTFQWRPFWSCLMRSSTARKLWIAWLLRWCSLKLTTPRSQWSSKLLILLPFPTTQLCWWRILSLCRMISSQTWGSLDLDLQFPNDWFFRYLWCHILAHNLFGFWRNLQMRLQITNGCNDLKLKIPEP